MFVFSCKTTKKQLFWALVCIILLTAILLTLAFWPDKTTATAAPAAPTATAATADDGIAYLKALGYTATGGDIREMQVPEEFDETLTAYNQLQQSVGMDLLPYRGKRLKCRTYTVTGHPSGQAAVAHLYLYKDTVVGGDISAAAADGFSHALMPADKVKK